MHRHPATQIELGGFRVGFDWSVLIVLGLVAWSLATQVLPTGFPGHSREAYWVAAVVAAGLFLGSLVMHELSHAIAARRVAGVEVEDITFWLFGGIARIRGELPTPRLQLLVAGIGPLTSLALGVVFWGVAVLLAKLGAGSLVAGTVLWLGVMNGALAVFNLIPGSPLDGGRVLHAILWRLRGDRTRAALAAARVGQGVGAILVGLGIFGFLLGGNGGGLWTALIGWFVLGAARAEAQVAGLRTGLGEPLRRLPGAGVRRSPVRPGAPRRSAPGAAGAPQRGPGRPARATPGPDGDRGARRFGGRGGRQARHDPAEPGAGPGGGPAGRCGVPDRPVPGDRARPGIHPRRPVRGGARAGGATRATRSTPVAARAGGLMAPALHGFARQAWRVRGSMER